MKINKVYSFLDYIRRKDPIGGSASVPEKNQIAERAVFEFFKKIMGLPSQYQKGARDPVIGFGLNAVSEEKIRPLKVMPTALTLSIEGFADYPEDYFRRSSCFTVFAFPLNQTRNVIIPFVNDAKFDERLTTVLDPPQDNDPVGNLQADKIRFLPIALPNVQLSYIKYPTSPVMGYVVDPDTAEEVYVDRGGKLTVTGRGVDGNTILVQLDSILPTIGDYTVQAGDTVEDIMKGLVISINTNTLLPDIKAAFDGESVVIIDTVDSPHTTINGITPGGATITYTKEDFSSWSTQFDWENDNESMNDIIDIMLDIMGISNRDTNIVQWAKTEQMK